METLSNQLQTRPQFRVAVANVQTVYYDANIDFELRGNFDRTDGVHEGRGWLLLPERESLVGDVKFLDLDARVAVFVTAERWIPNLRGTSVPYLPGRWKPYHVWMTIEPGWVWNRILFDCHWSREHCDICRRHIEPGEYGFVDRGGHKVCEKCHAEYITPHDLSFVERF